jgi:hypothetical protein
MGLTQFNSTFAKIVIHKMKSEFLKVYFNGKYRQVDMSFSSTGSILIESPNFTSVFVNTESGGGFKLQYFYPIFQRLFTEY